MNKEKGYTKLCSQCGSADIKMPPAGMDLEMMKKDYCVNCGNWGVFPEIEEKKIGEFRKRLKNKYEEIRNIGKIIKILKKESKNWKYPFVSEWSRVVKDPFTTLISCLLSLRTKDETTAKASVRLLKKYNTPQKILKLGNKQIEKLIYPVGFYKTKAKRIREICKVLIEKYNGKVPDTFEELIKLKGVGPKTASITVVYGFNKNHHIPVDVHVHVIANRLGWIKTKTPEKSQIELEKIIPKKYWYGINELFVQFGQNICITISPWCSRCPIEKFCPRVGVKKSR